MIYSALNGRSSSCSWISRIQTASQPAEWLMWGAFWFFETRISGTQRLLRWISCKMQECLCSSPRTNSICFCCSRFPAIIYFSGCAVGYWPRRRKDGKRRSIGRFSCCSLYPHITLLCLFFFFFPCVQRKHTEDERKILDRSICIRKTRLIVHIVAVQTLGA